MMTITGVDLNRDGIPDVLQQPVAAVSYAAPAVQTVAPAPAVYAAPAPAVQYVAPAPAVYAAPAAATAVSYAAPAVQYAAPAIYAAPAAGAFTVTGVDMNRDGIPDV